MGIAFNQLYEDGLDMWPEKIISTESEYLDDKLIYGKMDTIIKHYEDFVQEHSLPHTSLMTHFQWFMVGYFTNVARRLGEFELRFLKREHVRRAFHHDLYECFRKQLLGEEKDDGSIDLAAAKIYLIAEGVWVEEDGAVLFKLGKYDPSQIGRPFP